MACPLCSLMRCSSRCCEGRGLKHGVFCQDLRERDALCNADGCYVVYFQRKSFLDSWRACKEKGGNLATIKRSSEARTIASLFSTVDLRYSRTKVQVWIGLQRQPRQCAGTRPLRGYSWTTGDQDTEYTNWLKEDSANLCTVPRCVAMSYSTTEQTDNFKWIDGSCSVPVEAYLCYYGYQQMCAALPSEGAGSVLYNTPFNLVSTILTHVPFGSVATVPCPGDKEETVLCMLQDNYSAGWSKSSPICQDVQIHYNWCDDDNGGCEHYCKQKAEHVICECDAGYHLGEDGQSCDLVDPCQEAPCEYECLLISDSYRCACPDGYMLAPDERSCVDVDECLQSPCEQLCVNSPGTFQCTCREGYEPGVDSECEDVDECAGYPCEHACENTDGSHVCHCHLGYSPLPEDPSRCQDIDECQIAGTCEQMCVNYDGGFQCDCEEGYEVMDDMFSCEKIGAANRVTPSYPLFTHETPLTEDYDPDNYEWTQVATDAPRRVDAGVFSVTRSPQDAANSNQKHHFPTIDIFPQRELDMWGEHSDIATTANPTQFTSTPIASTTPDWYEDEESTTASPPMLPTTTISGGAWNFLNNPYVDPLNYDPYINYKIPEKVEPDAYTSSSPETEEIAKDYEDIAASHEPFFPTASLETHSITSDSPGAEREREIAKDQEDISASHKPFFPSESGDSSGVGRGVDLDSVPNDKEPSQDSTWLLIGLLVPICIFVVVMLALGIAYCARYTAQSRNNKSTTDCYHWISGAHDKQGAANPSAGVKTHV
ncbi:hypothetical protein WMY93_014975 [Mugilogobius chulae]|uniref:CD248 molecule, endosialin a n=1 Tax=Mugilogobius chulae TaxID=88201 RepID=A0AAW0NW57_9GOBI